MQTNRLPVCDIGIFENASNFWISSIDRLVDKYPHLEFPHVNTFYTFLILESAKGGVILDNNCQSIDEKKVIVIKPNCITEIYLNKEAVGKVICFTEAFFSLRYNNNILNQFSFFKEGKSTSIKLSEEVMDYLNSLLMFMYNEFNNKNSTSRNALRSYLNIVLIELERVHKPLKRGEVINSTMEKVSKFQRLIDENFKTIKNPSEYAKMLNLSTNYLNKICKKTLGQTSGELIRKHILLEAQRFLHYTNLSINEIANELGFEHSSYFVTIFKKETNKTPEQYRKSRIAE